MASYYPRGHWFGRLRNTFIALMALFAVGFGFAIIVQTDKVITSRIHHNQQIRANHLWRMVAGQEPIDNSQLGQLAQVVREQKAQPNPVRALRTYYVKPGQFPGADGKIGYSVAHTEDSQGTTENEGLFTARFILDSLEAEPATVDGLIRPVPDIKSYGHLHWRNLVSGVGVLLVTGLALMGLLAIDRQRWRRRETKRRAQQRQRLLAALPNDEARQVYGIIEQLEQAGRPLGSKERALLGEAQKLYASLTTNPLGEAAEFSALQRQLRDISERWELTQQAHRELMGS